MGLNSPWGSRGELCKNFGWTYDYLLWGISWLNVQLMVADAARIKDLDTENNEESGSDEAGGGKVEHRELKTKEDIKNYIKGLM